MEERVIMKVRRMTAPRRADGIRVRVVLSALVVLASASGCDSAQNAEPAKQAPGTVAEGVMGAPAQNAAAEPSASEAPKDSVLGVGSVRRGASHAAAAPRPTPAMASGGFGRGTDAKGESELPFGMIGLLSGPVPAATVTAPAAGQGPLAQRAAADVADAPARHLDPNARYQTTYRPGGAALAAFDAAVGRGQIPHAYQDLVGDFGARYAPVLPAPKDGALAITVDTERAAIGPQGGPLNLLVALASSEATPSRAPLSVHIVLDISGSMSGQAIEDAKHAAEATVAKLDPTDDFSMVTFSSDAQVLVSDGPIGPRRDRVLARIREVHADGGTNISSGLDLGYAEARAPGAGDDAVRIVMLLSDGHANAGDTDPQHLADRAAHAFQDGIQTSTFGLGPDFDASLMSGIADRGVGGYYYLADSSQIEPALAREIDARLRPVATAVELRVRLRPDVSATHVFGSRELSDVEAQAVRDQELVVDKHEAHHGITSDRQTDAKGGMRFFIPAFARADRHATMITLDVPPGTDHRRIASVEVRYKDRVLQKNVTTELPVDLRWVSTDAESASTANPAVQRVEQAFAAGEGILQAAELVDRGDRNGARTVIRERAAVLRSAATRLAEPRLLEEAGRLDRLSDAVGGTQAIADALPLVVMLRGSGYGYL
jgi:Ca-activated chloride channel homolog